MRFITPRRALAALSLALCVSCGTRGPTVTAAFVDAPPRSILVLPPLDQTLETQATYVTYAAVARPLVELGYYVFPPAVVDGLMRDNGLPSPVEMHGVPLAKLDEIFSPDAVMYITVTRWGTSYQILNSVTEVAMSARLLDAKSGELLWEGESILQDSSAAGQTSLAGLLIGAVASQVASSVADESPRLARAATWRLLGPRDSRLARGPYHPEFAAQLAELREVE